jgi:hypothetical protein
MAPPYDAKPHHRHQISLEGVFSIHTSPLDNEVRKHASERLIDICQRFDLEPYKDYSRPKLIRFTYDWSTSTEGRDNFLRAFYKAVDLQINRDEPIDDYETLKPKFFAFGDYLFDNFFLPSKATLLHHVAMAADHL